MADLHGLILLSNCHIFLLIPSLYHCYYFIWKFLKFIFFNFFIVITIDIIPKLFCEFLD